MNDIGDNCDVANEKDPAVKRTYAESLKTNNILLIKSNDVSKPVEKKKAIMSKITTPVENVKETRDGNLAVNFADRSTLEEAKLEFDRDDTNNITVNEKTKIRPKIKLVNVSKDEEDIINSIRVKNPRICSLIENDDIKVLKILDARDEEKNHCHKMFPKGTTWYFRTWR